MPRTNKPLDQRFWEKVDRRGPGECWEWTGARCATAGHGSFRIDGRTKIASRVAYEFVVGPVPPGMFVCHRCDNPPCVNPAHLFLGTAGDNMRDMARKGRSGRPNQRLSDVQVVRIREMWASGDYAQGQLAKEFGISRPVVSMIVRGTRWRGAGGPISAPRRHIHRS